MRLYIVKYLILFCALLFSATATKCQNLVPNPSFEDTVSCPTTANQLDKCANWWPSLESPDYFHECDFITGQTGVPNNFCGFQYAFSGKAYLGFIPFTRTASNGREYFTCQLLSPLTIGTSYNVSYYLNWSAGSGKKIACNNIGFFFSTVNYDLNNPLQIQNFAHVYTDSIIKDSINWVYISKLFVADSNYSYLSIGNFFEDSFTDTISLDPSAHAYYYIDDVSIVPDSASSLNSADSLNYNVYPNPFVDYLTIELENANNYKIEIINLFGQIVFSKSYLNVKVINLDLKSLKSGIYFLSSRDDEHLNTVNKIIKN